MPPRKEKQMKDFELIDERFEIEFEWSYKVDDFKIINQLVNWCDSYTRDGILIFHFLKDCTNYLVYFERDETLRGNIKKMGVYVRKPSHRLEWEDRKIKEFQDWICKKWKSANPKITPIKSEEQLSVKSVTQTSNEVCPLGDLI